MSELSFDDLQAARASHPERIAELQSSRRRRPLLREDGKLFIIAVDHPARGALGIRQDPLAMANRYDLLSRIVTALSVPGVDGVLGTPDILEDLLLLGALDDKIAVGSMNRGGLRGASFEMDDRFTAYTAASIVRARFDFAKLLLRVDLNDAGSAATLEASARAVSEAADLQLPIMLEPFMSTRTASGIVNDLSTEAVINSVSIASGLGTSSAYSWLKLPVVPEMERVMEATTLPTLLLGGEPGEDQDANYENWSNALALPGVRGLVVGRALLYPASGNVVDAVSTAASLVHGGVLAVAR
ncbi:Cgl0159 family (beta/alpha)8-fold protein [Plantibacter sp. YIM 135347]|uniref:Cgl0159 family (beta/alpha)8-fold protein n=1 Tax=Plantibacter sp. YIM 135347 TaxID=3423919 RepID=UPI003D3405CB